MTQEELDNALFEAVKAGDAQKVKELIDAGADVDAINNWYQTPLHYCSIRSIAEVAKILIDAGADVNARDGFGNTPLYFCKDAEVAKLLIDAGAGDDDDYDDEECDEGDDNEDDLDEDESEACDNKKQTQTKTTPSRNHSTHKGEKMNTYNYWLIELSKDAWDLTKAELGDRHTIASRNKSGALKSKLGDLKAGELVLAFEAAPVSHVAKVLVVESARDQVNSDIYRDPVFKIVAEIPAVSLEELKEKMPDLHKRVASPAAIHCLNADDFQGVMKLAYCK